MRERLRETREHFLCGIAVERHRLRAFYTRRDATRRFFPLAISMFNIRARIFYRSIARLASRIARDDSFYCASP